MNTNMQMIPYTNSENNTIDTPSIIALSAFSAMMLFKCLISPVEEDNSEVPNSSPSSPVEEDSPPSSPQTPPIKPKTKKVIVQTDPDLDSKILKILAKNPGANVRIILTCLGNKVTKPEINSRLYTLLGKKVLRKEGSSGAPAWFIANTSTAIIKI
jgi:hypothetical protein